MNTRTTRDPISWNEVMDLDSAYCVYDGDGDNGIEIFFENLKDQQTYLALGKDHQIVLQGNDSADYIAEG